MLAKLGNLHKSVKALSENCLLVASSKQKERKISKLELKVIQLQSEIKDPKGWQKMIEDGLKDDKERKTVIAQVQSSYDVEKQTIADHWKYQKTKMRKAKR